MVVAPSTTGAGSASPARGAGTTPWPASARSWATRAWPRSPLGPPSRGTTSTSSGATTPLPPKGSGPSGSPRSGSARVRSERPTGRGGWTPPSPSASASWTSSGEAVTPRSTTSAWRCGGWKRARRRPTPAAPVAGTRRCRPPGSGTPATGRSGTTTTSWVTARRRSTRPGSGGSSRPTTSSGSNPAGAAGPGTCAAAGATRRPAPVPTRRATPSGAGWSSASTPTAWCRRSDRASTSNRGGA